VTLRTGQPPRGAVAVKANADATERMIRDVAKNYGYAR
jgi:hypothetical protein